jgi:hypothetical protein
MTVYLFNIGGLITINREELNLYRSQYFLTLIRIIQLWIIVFMKHCTEIIAKVWNPSNYVWVVLIHLLFEIYNK